MCVKMYNMKTASIRQIQHNLNKVLAWVENGEEVQIFRRKKLVAKIVPLLPAAAETPDFLGRAKNVWGASPRGKFLSEVLSQDRGER